MLELVSQNYWWHGLSRYVAKFIMGCDACNQTKTFPTQKVGKLIPNKVHLATHQTPFELDTRQHPCLGVEPMRTSTIEAADAFARQLGRTQEEAKAALKWAVDDMKWYYDQNHQVAPEYRVGDKAWLSLQNYSSDCPMKKLDHKWAGPFTITKVISPAAIKLHLST